MKIYFDFSIEIDVQDPESRAALLEVSAASNLADARSFLKNEARTMTAFYLASNGVRVIGDIA